MVVLMSTALEIMGITRMSIQRKGKTAADTAVALPARWRAAAAADGSLRPSGSCPVPVL
jgi:hypothetical protein